MKPVYYALIGSFVLGIGLYQSWHTLWPILCVLLLIAGLTAAFYGAPLNRQTLFKSLLCLSITLISSGWTQLREPHPDKQDLAQFAPLTHGIFTAKLLSDISHQGNDKWSMTVQAQQITSPQRQSVSGYVKVHLKSHQIPPLRIGDQVHITGRLAQAPAAMNFGAFSYRDYLQQQGMFSVIYAQDIRLLTSGPRWNVPYALQSLRLSILAGFEKAMPVGQARVLGSLLLGSAASPVPTEIQTLFQKTGLQHVLAVSGFQVQLLVMGMMAICLFLRCSRWLTAVLCLIALWLFVALTGYPASVLRAAVLASLGLLGYVRFRELDPLAGLSLGCVGLLLIQPSLLFDLGFQFSVLATFGLMLSTPRIMAVCDFLPVPITGLMAPILAAQIWVMPAQLWHFGSFSWLFLPANILAGLMTTLLSWLAIIGAALTPLPFLQVWVLKPAAFLTQLFMSCLQYLLYLPKPVLQGPNLATSLMLLAYLALLVMVLNKSKTLNYLLLTCALSMPLIQGGTWLQERNTCPVRISFIAVGQGDATLIETPQTRILIDAGPRWQQADGWHDAGERDILPYLQKRGIGQIDLAVISHGHLDHYGGLVSLLNNIQIKKIITVAGNGDSETYLDLLKQIQAKGIPFEYAQDGSVMPLSPELKLIFWQPVSDQHESLNDQSLVVQLIHDQVKVLFSGDIEALAESHLLQNPGFVPQHQILKVPHHGSHSSSTSEFLTQVQPIDAIMSVGERNRYHHPHQDVLERYRQEQIRTWRTDQHGAVCVCSQGKGYQIYTAQMPSKQPEQSVSGE